MQAHAVHDTVGHPCDLNPKAKVVQRRLKRIQFRYAQLVGLHVQQSCNTCTVKTAIFYLLAIPHMLMMPPLCVNCFFC
jgi:hypothetical protein